MLYCSWHGKRIRQFSKLDFPQLKELRTVNVRKLNVPFGKPNKIWFGYQTFGFQTFGSNRTNRNKNQFQTVRISGSVKIRNCLGTEPNLSCPKSERSDFGRLLYSQLNVFGCEMEIKPYSSLYTVYFYFFLQILCN